jgi:hypothetical protein
MCPNGILAVGCIPIGSVVILIMGHYYKFLRVSFLDDLIKTCS